MGERNRTATLEGERKTVTALFADIKGSTELMEELDPEDARAVIDPALKLMIEAVKRYDGYIVQSTGDGIFALFGAPVAHENHPHRALYSALRMQEELRHYSAKLVAEGGIPIQCRVGANSGEVVVRLISTGDCHTEYTPIGHTANLASRMQAVAPVGSIAASEATRRLCEGYFILHSLGPTRVRGLSEPVNVYEVTGLGPLQTRLQRAVGRGLTKFVGRQHEMEVLKRALEQARAGHGQIVAAMAEPGVGKSRLYYEFKAVAQSGCMVLETFSVSHGKASAYLPVIDLLYGFFDIGTADDSRKRREKITGRVVALDRALEDTLPYLFALLGIVEGDDPLAQMDGQIKKRRTLEAIKRILLRESLNQPLMVIFEDLNWIDEATQEFLNLLADSIGTAKILLMVNYRTEYSHQWGSKTYYTQLRLDPLGKESAAEMLSSLLDSSPLARSVAGEGKPSAQPGVGEGADLASLKRLIIEKTEGNPFFMEETVQVLLDEGALQRNGVAKLTKPLAELKIPPTVQAILASRIDRLPQDAKDLLQTLAVIGREYPLSLIRAVVTQSDDELSRLLDGLQLSEFIYEQPAVGDTEYIFKHALTQEVAVNSVLIERRKQLHAHIGQALEMLYSSSLDDHLAELAHHYGRGNNPAKAVHYLALAAKQGSNRSAFAEAQSQLQQGLEWVDRLPESVERDARELELASTLAMVLVSFRGFTDPESRAAAARAVALAEKGGNLAQHIQPLYLTLLGVLGAGDCSGAAALADRILDLAQREGSPTSLAFAHLAQEQVRYYSGDVVAAEEHFARMSDSLDTLPRPMAVSAIAHASCCAWMLGHADSARERNAQMIAVARDKNPYDMALGRVRESWLHWLLRDPQRVEAAASHALALSEAHGFRTSTGRCSSLGWARAQLGSAGEGVSLIRQALADTAKAGERAGITCFLTWLAEAQALDGTIDDALSTIEEAPLANPEELVFRPYILNCRGELRLKVGQSDLAEADFREAIALAQKMSAKSYELRATTSLARLLAKQGRCDEARTMLANTYNWFTEGFDTADLKDARALLDELAT